MLIVTTVHVILMYVAREPSWCLVFLQEIDTGPPVPASPPPTVHSPQLEQISRESHIQVGAPTREPLR